MLPILAVTSPLVISSTAVPIFMDDANADADTKLPCPIPFIMVAPSV